MDRPVALKIVHRHLTDSPAAAERFRREVRTAARLNHPNIVSAYDADEAEGLHFLVMEYVEGQSLGDVLRRDGRLPVDLACDIIRQAAVGLQFAHEQGMVHRDVKPDNLMITPAGRVKILDFGLARFARGGPGEARPEGGTNPAAPSQLTLAGTLMGTPDYMAPEQSDDSSRADVRADVYGLGCTLYQALTGQVPFPKGTALERITFHASQTPTPVRQLREEVPEALAAVVEKMMAKSPADRYREPAEVAEALAPFAPRPAVVTGGAPPQWGWRAALALVAAVALLLALALIGWLR
jgi:eukaryotic-like serine/threonine-protein kinase